MRNGFLMKGLKFVVLALVLCFTFSNVFAWGWWNWGPRIQYVYVPIPNTQGLLNRMGIAEGKINVAEGRIDSGESRLDIIEQKIDEVQNGGSSDTKHYPTYANGALIGNTEIAIDYAESTSDVKLKFADNFNQVTIDNAGRIINKPSRSNSQIVLYEFDGCIGRTYRFISENGYLVFKQFQGSVFPIENDLFYFPANAPILDSVTILSSKESNSNQFAPCNDIDPPITAGFKYIEVFINDPAITGINEYPFPAPITFDGIEVQE